MSVTAGTLYRRGLARMERRAHGSVLRAQAARLVNRLAYAAGYAGPLSRPM